MNHWDSGDDDDDNEDGNNDDDEDDDRKIFYPKPMKLRELRAVQKFIYLFTNEKPRLKKSIPIISNILRHRKQEHIKDFVNGELNKKKVGPLSFMKSQMYQDRKDTLHNWWAATGDSKRLYRVRFDHTAFLQAHPPMFEISEPVVLKK